MQTYLDARLHFLLLRRRGCLALSVYGGREEKAQCQNISNQITIMSSAISEGEKKKINLACRWAKFNAVKKNASKTAFTSKKSVSSCCIMVPNKFHMSDEECSVVLRKRNGRHHLYSYKFSSCLESCCHWKKQDYFSAINEETWQDWKGLEGAVIREVYIPQHLPAKRMQHWNM